MQGRSGTRSIRTRTHASAACAFVKRTLATPSASLSNRTTLVTCPNLAHSSRMSSLISSMLAGSSCRSVGCGRQERIEDETCLKFLERKHMLEDDHLVPPGTWLGYSRRGIIIVPIGQFATCLLALGLVETIRLQPTYLASVSS